MHELVTGNTIPDNNFPMYEDPGIGLVCAPCP